MSGSQETGCEEPFSILEKVKSPVMYNGISSTQIKPSVVQVLYLPHTFIHRLCHPHSHLYIDYVTRTHIYTYTMSPILTFIHILCHHTHIYAYIYYVTHTHIYTYTMSPTLTFMHIYTMSPIIIFIHILCHPYSHLYIY